MERRELLEERRKQARRDQQIAGALRWQLERQLGRQLELGADPEKYNPDELQSYTLAQEHYTALAVRELIAEQPPCSTPCVIRSYFAHPPKAVAP
tara:strand:+ start:925 stop:1209 length:285 start_codon:yes stop_codon:yes gene_type:complete